MKNVKVSVIIPVYDIPSEMLKDCAQSLLNQTLEDMEFIFINDNSPNTQNKSYLLALQKEDPRVVFIDLSQNKGVSNARNEGLQKASGQYVGFVDADDTVENNMYEQMYLRAESEKADFVICNTRCYINDKDDFIETSNSPLSLNICTENDLLYLFNNGGLGSWDKLFRTDLVRDIRFNVDISNYEDYLFNWQVFLLCKKVIFVGNVFYNARFRTNSASRSSMSFQKCRGIFCALSHLSEISKSFYQDGFKIVGLLLYYKILFLGILNKNILVYIGENVSKDSSSFFFDYIEKSLLWGYSYLPCYIRFILKRHTMKCICGHPSMYYYILLRFCCLIELSFISDSKNSRMNSLIKVLKEKLH